MKVGSHRKKKTHGDVEVHRALKCEFTESPYLVGQLSAFDDRQHITGLPGMVIDGLQHMQNLTMNVKTMIYTGSGH
jgi:hypothetical protein